jgi:hypothetical protein
MAEDRSPWASADTEIEVSALPAVSVPTQPVEAPERTAALTRSPQSSSIAVLPARSRGGAVTRTNGKAGPRSSALRPAHAADVPAEDILQFGDDDRDDPIKRNKMLMRWFGGAAAMVVLVGVIATLIMVLGNGGGLPVPKVFEDQAAPPDTRPELVKDCPPPSSYPDPQPAPPTPPGPRTVDDESGVSYKAYGAPWSTWPMVWTGGSLKVDYKIGQHFVTEKYGGGDYHASILSSSIPATNNDSLAVDLRCTGRVVATDVRDQYYPQPNRLEQLDEKLTTLGGRPAWVTKFRLHFNKADLDAKSELVGLALIDVGRPEAAIVYISIPDTHRQYDGVVDEVLDSIRPA